MGKTLHQKDAVPQNTPGSPSPGHAALAVVPRAAFAIVLGATFAIVPGAAFAIVPGAAPFWGGCTLTRSGYAQVRTLGYPHLCMYKEFWALENFEQVFPANTTLVRCCTNNTIIGRDWHLRGFLGEKNGLGVTEREACQCWQGSAQHGGCKLHHESGHPQNNANPSPVPLHTHWKASL